MAPGWRSALRINTLSAALLPLAAGLWLLTVAVTPRAALDRRGLRRTAVATLLTLGSFLTESARGAVASVSRVRVGLPRRT